jgi:hypothetical protein
MGPKQQTAGKSHVLNMKKNIRSLEISIEDMLFVVDGVLEIAQLTVQSQPSGVAQSEVQLPQTHEVLLQQTEVDLRDELLLHDLRVEQEREFEGVADFLGCHGAVHVAEETHHGFRQGSGRLFEKAVVLLGGREEGEVSEMEESPSQGHLSRSLKQFLQLPACTFTNLSDCCLNQILEVP